MMRSLVSIDSFKAIYSWAYGLMKRFKLKLFKPVAVQMKDWNNVCIESIPIRQKINGFFQYYDQLKSRYNYKDECILNLDETPVYFENHHKRTIYLMSAKEARVKVVGNIRSRVTCVLMVDSTGMLYDPCIIQQGDGLKYSYLLGGLNVWKQKNNTKVVISW